LAQVPHYITSDSEDVLGGPIRSDLRGLYPPIPLAKGNGRWRITSLDWYFAE